MIVILRSPSLYLFTLIYGALPIHLSGMHYVIINRSLMFYYELLYCSYQATIRSQMSNLRALSVDTPPSGVESRHFGIVRKCACARMIQRSSFYVEVTGSTCKHRYVLRASFVRITGNVQRTCVCALMTLKMRTVPKCHVEIQLRPMT